MRVLCWRACSSSSTCCSSEGGPAAPSPSRATPSRQLGIEDVLRNFPGSAAPGRSGDTPGGTAGRSPSACGDSLGDTCGDSGGTGGVPHRPRAARCLCHPPTVPPNVPPWGSMSPLLSTMVSPHPSATHHGVPMSQCHLPWYPNITVPPAMVSPHPSATCHGVPTSQCHLPWCPHVPVPSAMVSPHPSATRHGVPMSPSCSLCAVPAPVWFPCPHHGVPSPSAIPPPQGPCVPHSRGGGRW